MVKNHVEKDFYALTRHLLGKSWQERYPGRQITATGLKGILRRHIESVEEPECAIIRKFVGISDLSIVDDLVLVNRAKCIENFYKGRTQVLKQNTLDFIVDFFQLQFKSVDDYERSLGSSMSFPNELVKLKELVIDPADLRGFIRVCILIYNAIPKPLTP